MFDHAFDIIWIVSKRENVFNILFWKIYLINMANKICLYLHMYRVYIHKFWNNEASSKCKQPTEYNTKGNRYIDAYAYISPRLFSGDVLFLLSMDFILNETDKNCESLTILLFTIWTTHLPKSITETNLYVLWIT